MKLKEIKESFQKKEFNKSTFIEKMYSVHETLFDYADYIGSTDIKKIEITDGKVVLTTRNDTVHLIAQYPDRRIIPIEILNFSTYENEILDFFKKIIKPDWTIFDIGGNVGWYTINLKKHYKDLNIFTFEPIPKTFEMLTENCELNKIPTDNLFNIGFSDEDKDAVFYVYPEGCGNSSLQNLSGNSTVKEIRAKLKRIDTFIKENNLKIDYIKIDVEGAEFLAFKGAYETIKRDKPIIFTELLRKWSAKFNYHPNDVIKWFKDLGYACYFLNQEKLSKIDMITDDTLETNFFFLHAEKHKSEINKFK